VAVGGIGGLLRSIGCHRTIIEGLLVLIPSRAPHLISADLTTCSTPADTSA